MSKPYFTYLSSPKAFTFFSWLFCIIEILNCPRTSYFDIFLMVILHYWSYLPHTLSSPGSSYHVINSHVPSSFHPCLLSLIFLSVNCAAIVSVKGKLKKLCQPFIQRKHASYTVWPERKDVRVYTENESLLFHFNNIKRELHFHHIGQH